MKLEPELIERAYSMAKKGFAVWEMMHHLNLPKHTARRLRKESLEFPLTEVLSLHAPGVRKPRSQGGRPLVLPTIARSKAIRCAQCGALNMERECRTCAVARAKQEAKEHAKDNLSVLVGNVFSSGCTSVVIPVNCEGVMGAGLAYRAKKRFSGLFAPYQAACQSGALAPGAVFSWKAPKERKDGFEWVFCVPTKTEWRKPSSLPLVAQSLPALRAALEKTRTPSVAVPALGCGLGALEWALVRPVLIQALRAIPGTQVRLYEPVSGD